ncbi:hypothetical protein SCP_0100520 [Sparassis crispa]|uniref:Uncharacterized protein n=1 Tax=Sparassis crispa TaxID=139825 RepID=A0A401G4U8_9APHY|nr:hypothetical protein SCP_0100520 [Sparassis crispa]GBE77180.1 hypothetical protein SCP_0100520 [Sparassis crispa]
MGALVPGLQISVAAAPSFRVRQRSRQGTVFQADWRYEWRSVGETDETESTCVARIRPSRSPWLLSFSTLPSESFPLGIFSAQNHREERNADLPPLEVSFILVDIISLRYGPHLRPRHCTSSPVVHTKDNDRIVDTHLVGN